MGKYILALLVVAVLGLGGYYFTRDEVKLATQQVSNNGFFEMETGKMGDDPIYSEEIKKNTALVTTTGAQVNDLKQQLKDLRQESAESERQHKIALDEIKALTKTLKDLKDQALDNSNTDLSTEVQQQVDERMQAISDSVQKLSETVTETNEQNRQKIKNLEMTLSTPPEMLPAMPNTANTADNLNLDTNEPPAPSELKKPSRTIYAYGYEPEQTPNRSGNDLVSSVMDKATTTANGIGDFLTGTQREQNAPDEAQAVILPTPTKKNWETVFPVYTLPANTVLANSTLITPIIGRVPLATGKNDGGNGVTDPFYFKVEIGGDNLAANGHKIPGVAKMIASGYSTGVREQSCVRGYIDTVTFIFVDGRIANLGELSGEGSAHNDAIGYLADQWGKPCIRGHYINNAKDYLKSRGAAAFLEAAAEGLSQSQTSYSKDSEGNYQAILDGDVWSYVLGKGVGGSATEVADYVRERTANAFDVVYVEQAQPVQIWLNKQLPVDYDSKARKIQYYAEPTATSYYD